MILITTRAKTVDNKIATQNKFLISIQYEKDKIILQGLKGCAFKELTFTIKDNSPVSIDQFGMKSPKDKNRNTPGDTNSDFLFAIEKNHDLINLTGKTGTNWITLSFGAINKKHFISETGVFFARDGVDGPIFSKVDEMPEFPGGELAMREWIASKIKYPVIAQENGIQGKVYVTFVITKEGKVTDPKIAKGVDPSLDKEALRVVCTLPMWKPGMLDGEPVNVSYTVPITFALM